MLEKFPEMGVAMVGPFTGFRSTIVSMFRIVYRVLPRAVVEIAYIRNCRRAPPA